MKKYKLYITEKNDRVMDDLLASLKVTYDYIIIDCGLQHELLAVNALYYSSIKNAISLPVGRLWRLRAGAAYGRLTPGENLGTAMGIGSK